MVVNSILLKIIKNMEARDLSLSNFLFLYFFFIYSCCLF